MFSEDKYNVNHAEFLLSTLTDEMNRLRDWPIRILGFTSALHFAVIAGILVTQIEFIDLIRWLLTSFFTALFVWTAYYFWKCHINYITTRNAQINLESKIGIAEMDVIPRDWLLPRKVSGFTAMWGWGFYLFVAAGFWLATVGVVWFPVVTRIQEGA